MVRQLTLLLAGRPISWADKIKYLGIYICSNKVFTVDLAPIRRKFFIAVNVILNNTKSTSDFVRLQILENQCLPILTYAIESLNLNQRYIKEINSWWNMVYRKCFNFNKWESVKELICRLGRLDIHHLISMRRLLFYKRLLSSVHSNALLSKFSIYFSTCSEYFSVQHKYVIKTQYSYSNIKRLIFNSFADLCGVG